MEKGALGPLLHAKFHHYRYIKCGLKLRKIVKICIFVSFASPRAIFLQNLAWGRESNVRTFMPNFTIVGLEMWPRLTAPKSSRGNFFVCYYC